MSSCSYLKKLSAPKLTEVTDKWDTSYMQYVDEGDLELPLLRKIGVIQILRRNLLRCGQPNEADRHGRFRGRH